MFPPPFLISKYATSELLNENFGDCFRDIICGPVHCWQLPTLNLQHEIGLTEGIYSQLDDKQTRIVPPDPSEDQSLCG